MHFTDWLSAISGAILAFLGFFAYVEAREKFFKTNKKNIIGYQAIFLTNGQVYFGKIVEADKDFVELKYIYYLQTGPEDSPNKLEASSLVKLGNELHGPDDAMYINRQQILFWENLKEDGQVLRAIRSYENSIKNSKK